MRWVYLQVCKKGCVGSDQREITRPTGPHGKRCPKPQLNQNIATRYRRYRDKAQLRHHCYRTLAIARRPFTIALHRRLWELSVKSTARALNGNGPSTTWTHTAEWHQHGCRETTSRSPLLISTVGYRGWVTPTCSGHQYALIDQRRE